MSGEVKAALIGSIVAAVLSPLILFLYERWKERRDRGRIASALLVEVIAQAEFISVLAQAVHMPDALPLRESFAKFLPPPSIVYHALAAQLPILGTREASCVIAFHGAISWACSLVNYLPTTIEYSGIKGGPHVAADMPAFHSATLTDEMFVQQTNGLHLRLQQAAAAAAFNAILTIRALDAIASHDRLSNDETMVADVFRKLEAAARLNGDSH